MNELEILEFVKNTLGITFNDRDAFLLKLIEGAKADLANLGINTDGQDDDYISSYERHLVAYVAWLYQDDGQSAKPPMIREGENNLQIGYNDVE